MAKRRKAYKRGYKKGRRSQSKGGIMGYRLMDIGQGVYNCQALGYIDAAKLAINGDLENAGYAVSDKLSDPGALINLTVDNVIIGFNRKLLRKMGGKFVRKFIA